METVKLTLKAAADMLRDSDNILLLMHTRPDGDTVGSAIALETALRALGKRAYAVCDDDLPERLMFILKFHGGESSCADDISGGSTDAQTDSGCTACADAHTEPDCTECTDALNAEDKLGTDILRPENLPEDFVPELTVTVDVASAELLGDIGETLAGKIDLKLDHHPMGTDFAKYSLIYPGASACGELIFDLVSELGALSRPVARAVYAAISSDSGSFRFDSVTAQTHERAAKLLRMDISHGKITEALYNTKTLGELAAEALAIDNLRMYCGGKIALTVITLAEMERLGISKDDTGGINGMPMCIRGVVISLVLKQDQDSRCWKLSVRTGDGAAANEICAQFGGGGHVRAAGCRFKAASHEEAVKAVLDAVSSVTGLRITQD